MLSFLGKCNTFVSERKSFANKHKLFGEFKSTEIYFFTSLGDGNLFNSSEQAIFLWWTL